MRRRSLTLADGRGARLRKDHARHRLQLRHTRAVLVPPEVAGHGLGSVHDPAHRTPPQIARAYTRPPILGKCLLQLVT